jgi:copper transport protein
MLSILVVRALRRSALVLVSLLLALAAVLATASPASAHAELESSTPVAGSVVAEPPGEISLTFDDPIVLDGSTLRVFDDRGGPLDVGPLTAASTDGRRISVSVPSALASGTYTVDWAVASEDTHPVTGSFTFSVLAPSAVVDVPAVGHNDLAGALLGAMRWAGYVGLVLGPGLILVLLLVWPEALREHRARVLVGTGLGLLSLSTLGGMVLQGVWASGASFGDLLSAPETVDTHSRKFDAVYAWRAYLVVAFSAVVVLAMSRSSRLPDRPRRVLLGVVAGSTLALAATWPMVSHSAVDSLPLAAGFANLVHSLAMSVWLGGLVMILFCLPADGGHGDAPGILRRFSRVAAAAVALLVVSGVVMAVREVGSLDGLLTSEFGRVLLAKLATVAVLLIVGDLSRRWVRRRLASSPVEPTAVGEGDLLVVVETGVSLAILRRTVMIEVALASVVLAVTAALVVIRPGA